MSQLSTARTEPPRELPAGGGMVASFEQLFVDHAPFVWRALRRLGVHGVY